MSDLLVSRRNFMKGTGAVVLATACSGLLTGCSGGGSGNIDSDEAKVGDFDVKIISAETTGESVMGENGMKYVFKPTIRLTYTGAGFTVIPFSSVFSATINGEKMDLVRDDNIYGVDFGRGEGDGSKRDELLKNIVSKKYYPEFKTENGAAYSAFENGTGAVVLTVTFNKQTANYTVTFDKASKKYSAKLD